MTYSKQQQTRHTRLKKLRRNVTRITKRVSDEVLDRSGGLCERCGGKQQRAWGFERAHLVNASAMGSGSEPWNIALLCAPKVETGTCHQWADETSEGKQWKQEYRETLIDYYSLKGWKT